MTMNRFYGVLALLLTYHFTACSAERVDSPVEREVLVNVLVELHLAHARSVLMPDDGVLPPDSLLIRHALNADDFRKAMRVYADHPDDYVALMDTVIDRMRRLRPDLADDPGQPIYPHRYSSTLRDTLEARRTSPSE